MEITGGRAIQPFEVDGFEATDAEVRAAVAGAADPTGDEDVLQPEQPDALPPPPVMPAPSSVQAPPASAACDAAMLALLFVQALPSCTTLNPSHSCPLCVGSMIMLISLMGVWVEALSFSHMLPVALAGIACTLW